MEVWVTSVVALPVENTVAGAVMAMALIQYHAREGSAVAAAAAEEQSYEEVKKFHAHIQHMLEEAPSELAVAPTQSAEGQDTAVEELIAGAAEHTDSAVQIMEVEERNHTVVEELIAGAVEHTDSAVQITEVEERNHTVGIVGIEVASGPCIVDYGTVLALTAAEVAAWVA